MNDEIINADFKDYEQYEVGKFDLLLSDIPYALGSAAYGSNPMWYKKGDNKKGVSELAGQPFFQTDGDFDLGSYARVCAALLKPSTGKPGEDGCVITFCSFEQQVLLISVMKEHGFEGYIPLSFVKKSSPQALKRTSGTAVQRSMPSSRTGGNSPCGGMEDRWCLIGCRGRPKSRQDCIPRRSHKLLWRS